MRNLVAVSGFVGHGFDGGAGQAQIGQFAVGQAGQFQRGFAIHPVASEALSEGFEQAAERNGSRSGSANVVCVSHVTFNLDMRSDWVRVVRRVFRFGVSF